jgi:hypothetical protein
MLALRPLGVVDRPTLAACGAMRWGHALALTIGGEEPESSLLDLASIPRRGPTLSRASCSSSWRAAPDFVTPLSFALSQGRAIVKDFVRLAPEFAAEGSLHNGIIVSNHLPFRELLRRILVLLRRHE